MLFRIRFMLACESELIFFLISRFAGMILLLAQFLDDSVCLIDGLE